jgi:hypothetical protein
MGCAGVRIIERECLSRDRSHREPKPGIAAVAGERSFYGGLRFIPPLSGDRPPDKEPAKIGRRRELYCRLAQCGVSLCLCGLAVLLPVEQEARHGKDRTLVVWIALNGPFKDSARFRRLPCRTGERRNPQRQRIVSRLKHHEVPEERQGFLRAADSQNPRRLKVERERLRLLRARREERPVPFRLPVRPKTRVLSLRRKRTNKKRQDGSGHTVPDTKKSGQGGPARLKTSFFGWTLLPAFKLAVGCPGGHKPEAPASGLIAQTLLVAVRPHAFLALVLVDLCLSSLFERAHNNVLQ